MQKSGGIRAGFQGLEGMVVPVKIKALADLRSSDYRWIAGIAVVFDPLEWKVSFRLGKKALPDGIPTLNQVIRNLAELGGFLGRKGDGEPGAKSIWLGYSRVLDCIYGIQMASELGEGLICV